MEARVAETYVAAGFTAHPIRIAGAFSLDSRDEFAQEGLQMKRASMMFADLINGKKGGLSVGNQSRSVHFMFVGDGSSEEGTQLAAERAIREDADFITAPYSSHLTRAASQVTQAASMILLAAGASSTSAFNSSNLTFRVYPPASQSLSSELDLLGLRLSNTNTTCGFIQSDSIWGRAACAPGPARARRNGLVVPNESISTIPFAASVEEVRTVLSTMQAADIDVIIGCTYDHESEALVRALQELNYSPKAVAVPIFSRVGPKEYEYLVRSSP
jgi:ABC-type branched-subunit amino acid transport system substrate-binding protein